jgi:hypothetical protein
VREDKIAGSVVIKEHVVQSMTLPQHRHPENCPGLWRWLVDSTPTRVAISWVQNRPGVASTIIGARTLKQLEDNLAALDVKLKIQHEECLNALTTPALNFPCDFVNSAGPFSRSSTTMNGVTAKVNPMAPGNESDRY